MLNKNTQLLTVALYNHHDLVIARQRARQIMQHLGFNNQAQIRMATAVSEIARNAYHYAQGGKAIYYLDKQSSEFCVRISDKGPGIANLAQILAGHHTSKSGPGRGIVGAKQIVDHCDIQTIPNQGTEVILRLKLPQSSADITSTLLEHIAQTLAKPEPNDVVHELQRQNQEILDALALINTARDELEQRVAERTAELLAANQQLQLEIEERKRVAQQLLETSTRLNLALKSARVGTWSWYSDKDRIYWDDYVYPLFGIPPGKFSGTYQDFIALLAPQEKLRECSNSLELIKGLAKEDMELCIKWPDGSLHYLMSRGQLFTQVDGKPFKTTGVFWDITQRKRIEEQFRLYQEQAAQAARISVMGGIASILAHEINQPLTIISSYTKGFLRRIQNQDMPDTQTTAKIMEKLAMQAERAGNIIHSIKDLVRKGTVQYECININQLLRHAVELIYQDSNKTKVKFQFKLAENLPTICLDKLQIEQVVLNILRNSIEALHDAGIKEPKITLCSTLLNQNRLAISICDNGPGFPPPTIARLFEPYFTTKSSGMGMGLAICRNIIEAHGGNIVANNLATGGACFQFELPIQQENSVNE